MKTLKKSLCIFLSVIMALSCCSLMAFAEGEETFTSTLKYYSTKDNASNAKVTLDEMDKILADLNICEEVVILEKPEIKITIDLRSVNALCATIDDYKGLLSTITTFAGFLIGDLKDLELSTWKKGLKRTGDDITILTELIELANANRSLVAGICDASLDLGIFADYINLQEIFGEDGVSGLIKEALFGFVYPSGTPEFTNAYNSYKNNVDAFIYNELFTKLTKDVLPGFTVNASSKIEDLFRSAYNITFDKYYTPAFRGININLAESEIPAFRNLDGILNLNGSTYDLSDLYLEEGSSVKDQLNNLIGKYIKLLVPGYDAWANGGYDKLSANIEKVVKYVATESGIIEKAEDKSLGEIGAEIALMIIRSEDFGAYEIGMEDCETLEDMLTQFLINYANATKIGVNYDGDEDYLVVAGDILAYYAYDYIKLADTNGKNYVAGGDKDVFEVANYILNFFLFDRKGAEVLGLSVKNTDTVFTKIDKLADYFGKTKSKGVSFNSKEFFLGSSSKDGLFDLVLNLDICGLFDLTLVPILENAGNVNAIEFLYKSVQYFLNNWAVTPDTDKGETPLFPEYTSKAFTNALSNKSIANMVALLLKTVEARKSSMVTFLTAIIAILAKGEDITYSISDVKVSDCTATGKPVTPTVTLKANGKALTQGTDFIVIADSYTPGTAKATIKGVGMYSGTIEREFNINMPKVTSLSYSSSTTSVTLKWNSVAYADYYNVYQLKNGSYSLIKKVSAPTVSYTIKSLSAGKEYKFKVEAVSDTYGKTAAKSVTAYTYPSAVGTITASDITPSSVKLTWKAVTGATHYRIETYTSSKKWKTVDTTTKTGKTITGLSSYTTYKYRVIALKKLSDGTYLEAAASSTKSVKTALGSPSTLKASYTSSTITLNWSKVTGATYYQILRYSGGKWSTVATVKSSVTSYKISKLKAGTKYVYAVRAAVKEGSKWVYGSRKELTQYTGIAKPSKISVSSTTTSSAKLTWSKVSGAKSYEVFMYKGGKWVSQGTTKKTSMTIKKLASGSKIKFKVRAVTKLGGKTVYGDYSSEVTAITLVGKVSGVKLTLRKTTSIAFKWSKVTGASGYEIYRYNGKKWVKIGTTTKTSYTDSKSLKKGTQYQYKVRAIQKISSKTTKYGAYSDVFKAKTTLVGSSKY